MAASGTVHGLRGEPQRTKSEQREMAKRRCGKMACRCACMVWPLLECNRGGMMAEGIRAGRRKNYLPVLFGGFMEKM